MRRNNSYSIYLTKCQVCYKSTSKSYARSHGGKCKTCAEGVVSSTDMLECPDCHELTLTAWQKARGYHCDNCTKVTDPIGYLNEVRGFNDGGDY